MCQIYVDDIIFGSNNQKSCEEFSRVMTQKFEMSMMGELNYFLGFQVKQLKDGTFLSQTKYTQDLLKRFGMKDAKPAKTLMGTDGHVDLNKGGKSVDQKAYRSMIGSLLYLCASRTKYYVIDINLAHKQITIICLSKKSSIGFPNRESISN